MASEFLYTVDTGGRLEPALRQEWLLTNGLGAYAMGSVVGCNSRRYHGLLCAATLPPVGRVLALNRIGEILHLDGEGGRDFELSINRFGDTYHPRGDRYLRRFELGDEARWTYEVEGVLVTKQLQLLWKRNIAGVRYIVDAGRPRKIKLDLLPFASLRDFHALRKQWAARFDVRVEDRRVIIDDEHSNLDLFVQSDNGQFIRQPDWWHNHRYAIDTERGQEDEEDLITPGRFSIETFGQATITLWASIEPLNELPDWDHELETRAASRSRYVPVGSTTSPGANASKSAAPSLTLRRLFRAADDFVVFRRAPDGTDGTSVIAGYPWFGDWGRDTFISLPGLLLETGRFEQARQVLAVFGAYVSEGMIPNVFDDYTSEPHYNTVDASLWYIHAAYEYLRIAKDEIGFQRDMLPACKLVIEGYKRGTRFDIKMEADGLITQGNPHTQLTWMDAKIGDKTFTPRQGKAVEINALWYHALVLMGEKQLAQQVGESFRKAYWISPFRGLADGVLAGKKDQAIRPNQIFAVSLPNSPLTLEQQQSVVEVVRRELLTPMGLRTLASSDTGYKGHYAGDQWSRDSAYHNGTVWPWLIGPFLSAYLKVNKRTPQAVAQVKEWLQPLIDQMSQNCIGQIPEICDGDEPHKTAGCPAQAWSVAETLRLAVELGM